MKEWITVKSTDYSRPSGLARWGWVYAAFVFLAGLPNLVLCVADPHWWRFLTAVITVAATTYCFRLWRQATRADAAHRAFMRAHQQRMAALDRRWAA